MYRNMLSVLFLSLALTFGACTPDTPSTPVIVNPGQGESGGSSEAEYKVFTVYGTVTDASTGKAISNVLVSDGRQIVKTDSKGKYEIVPNTAEAHNVFVIMPSEYEFTRNQWGGWGDFVCIDSSKKAQKADFKLIPRTIAAEKYRILILGDPQQMSSRQHSIDSWTYVSDAVQAYSAAYSGPLYQISLGDMVTNEIEVSGKAEAYLVKQKKCNVTTFSVPGNHDHYQKAKSYYDSVTDFSKWFGPYNYSFNLGKQHFVFLDSCAWCETEGSTYNECLNEEAITFLENDLSYVDKSTPVHICTHCPLTKKYDGLFPSPIKNHDRMMKALVGRSVNIWYGHIHFNSNFSYTAEELSSYAAGVKALDSHVVGRCGGCWACSGEVLRDGAPRGFVELDLNGTANHWQYHSIDSKYAHQWNFYYPGQFAEDKFANVDDTAVYCNVYMWDNLWTVPEIWVDGVKLGNMTKCIDSNDATYDPLYQHYYIIWKAEGKMAQRDEPSKVYDNTHLFKYALPSSTKNCQIRVTDRWGETLSADLSW